MFLDHGLFKESSMKISHGLLLRTFAVFLFSVTLVGGVKATPLSDAYEGMIAAAMAKSAAAEKIEALGGFAAVVGSVDAETAKEINPEFTTALTTVYNASQADLTLNPALKKMLNNAMSTPILDAGQKATVAQWISGLKDAAPAPTAVAAPVGGDLSSQAKTLNANAMQQLATVDTVFTDGIGKLDQEADDSKRLEGIYHLLQDAHGKTLSADVQERFGRLLVKAFNEAMETHSYLQQVLKEAVESKTPLLAQAQLDYVKKEMMPRVNGGAKSEAKEERKDAAAPTNAKAKKTLKKGKGKKKRAAASVAAHAAPAKHSKRRHHKKHAAVAAAHAHDTTAHAETGDQHDAPAAAENHDAAATH